MDRWQFYKKNILRYIDKNSNFLVISASEKEINIFLELGYKNLNITFHDEKNETKISQKKFLINKNLFKSDIRNLEFKNNSFDYVITNATIHHVDLPHLALTEMYRVAKKGVLVIESNDSLLMRMACKLNLADEFEVSSVDKKLKTGGLLDTGVPNYVFRWTENEVEKTLKSFDPEKIISIRFDYDNDLKNIKPRKNFLLNLIMILVKLSAKILFIFFKKQQNCLSIFIDKTKSNNRWA